MANQMVGLTKSSSHAKSHKKIWLLMFLGLCFPIFLVVMAYVAAMSDAKNQKKYHEQRVEIAKKHGLPIPKS